MSRSLLWIKRLFLYGGSTLIGLAVLLTIIIQVYQDDIIQKIIVEVNKGLKTRVEIAKIEVSLWQNFPHLSIVCQNIRIQGSLPARSQQLAQAGNLSFLFSLSNLFGDDLAIDQIILQDAEVQLYTNAKEEVNYDIVKSSSDKQSSSSNDVQFDLRRIRLQNVKFSYIDQSIAQDHRFLIQKTDARLFVKNEDYLIYLKGDLQSQYVRTGKDAYFVNKQLHLNSEMQYDYKKRKLLIQPSQVFVNSSEFQVMGYHAAKPHSFIDLQIEGKRTDIQTITSLLPESISKTYASYQSQGEIYFKGSVIGYTEGRSIPKVDVQFGCRNASIYETRLKKRIEQANLTGAYSNGNKQNRSSSSLTLKNIKGKLDGRSFSGNVSLQNFNNPHLAFDFRGTLDIGAVTAFFPYGIRDGSGLLTANFRFEGNLSDLRSQLQRRFVRTSGTIQLNNVAFTLTQRPLRLTQLSGDFSFNQSDLVIQRFSGYAGNSDFQLKGRFENILSYLLLDDQALRIVADLQSGLLNLDELLAENPTKVAQSTTQYRFRLSRQLDLALTYQVNKMHLRRFQAQNIQGDLDVHDGVARSKGIQLQLADGTMNLSIGMDAREPEQVQLSTNAELNNIQIDKVFYMFEDFGQDFIRSQHVHGKVNAHIQTYLVLNEHLISDNKKLVAEAFTTIRDGQLVNFEPMQKLSRFIKASELANLRFGEMQNNIHIEKGNVFIPLMEINSNIATISVQGTHSFDNVMDYHLRIPLKTFFQKRKTVETSSQTSGGTNLFLRINGTADNYKIGYDSKAMRDKMKVDMQARTTTEEKSNTRQSFLTPAKPAKVSAPKPKEEEYFDF
ncbi:AsmA family protein [Xanthocytophaga flava]|uniref:AsmA family protein n=1 Tax=Xanthocytophaga flava TaxID=3048013 RepID=UPI0028D2A6D6|nr:AsmA-like C-terminal region-containing protein [Xanthocytophaga flavus]MDJ1471325.1 AsmA-like C-terminal region-containing protein [Xanthocytophaga flavus]